MSSERPKPVPLRRRLRARLIGGAVRGAGWLPPSGVEGLLRPVAAVGIGRTRRGIIEANVARALPWFRTHAPGAAARLEDAAAFRRDVARVVAAQTAQWIRLARGAARPASPAAPDPGAWVDEQVELDPSVERLDEALAGGRGAIVVTAHLGSWDLLCARLARRGIPGAVVGRVRHDDPSHRWLVTMRAAYGVRTLPQDAPAREMLRVLKQGGVLGLLTDLRARRVHSVPADLFGQTVDCMTAAPAFARLARAPMVMMRCVQPPGAAGLRLSAEPPMRVDPGADRDGETMRLLHAQNRVFERWIAETPEQWAWHQPRFGR